MPSNLQFDHFVPANKTINVYKSCISAGVVSLVLCLMVLSLCCCLMVLSPWCCLSWCCVSGVLLLKCPLEWCMLKSVVVCAKQGRKLRLAISQPQTNQTFADTQLTFVRDRASRKGHQPRARPACLSAHTLIPISVLNTPQLLLWLVHSHTPWVTMSKRFIHFLNFPQDK